MLSVIVPTRNEERNVTPLVARTCDALGDSDWELLFVDDSDDRTPEVVRSVAHPRVRLLHRPAHRRDGGLAGAVCDGLAATRGDHIVVMDGDLQHDPGRLTELRDHLEHADVVIASRFADGGGGSAGLEGPVRRLVSRASRWTVRGLFSPIRRIRDPLSGYFGIRRRVIDGARLDPDGFKILLEILVRGRWRRVHEVPFAMAPRAGGASKASLREGSRFLNHLLRLRFAATTHGVTPGALQRLRRLGPFALVSLVSIGSTQLLLAMLIVVGLQPIIANALAVSAISVPTYAASRRWVWSNQRGDAWLRQGIVFWLVAVVGLIASTALVAVFAPTDATPLLANAVSIAAFGAVWLGKYLVLDSVVFDT
jgi:putative flippase GtrA